MSAPIIVTGGFKNLGDPEPIEEHVNTESMYKLNKSYGDLEMKEENVTTKLLSILLKC